MNKQALIFDIKRDCSEDGPGIRTTVFFQGCPLSCSWCQNPEGKSSVAQLCFEEHLCWAPRCNFPCIPACPAKCLSGRNKLHIDYGSCLNRRTPVTRKASAIGCEKCFNACPYNAVKPSAYWITAAELYYKVSVDKAFYHSSGGGVTLSGGEPTQQMDFLHLFLKLLKYNQIDAAIETCGFFNYRKFCRLILPYIDRIFFDLKLMDEQLSWKYLGQSNKLILANLKQLLRHKHIPLTVRIPLIPGITATRDNLRQIAEFLAQYQVESAVLLPYNPLWIDKLEKLNLPVDYNKRNFMTDKELQSSIRQFSLTH